MRSRSTGGGRKGFSSVSVALDLGAMIKLIPAKWKNDVNCVYQVLMVVVDCKLDGGCLENGKWWHRLHVWIDEQCKNGERTELNG
jgi:hypothetical protein